MSWLRVPLVPPALALAAGIALAGRVPAPWPWLLWGAAVGMALVLLALDRPDATAIALLVGVAGLGGLHARASPLAGDHVARAPLPRDALLEGTVVAEPVRLPPDRRRIILDVARADGAPRAGRVQVTLYGTGPAVQEGQRVTVRAHLRRAVGARNPDGFDYAAFLARDGIHVVAAASGRALTVLDPATPWHVEVRRRALGVMERTLPPVSAGLLGGLLLGARSDLPPDVLDGFRRAGVYHVLAVSGFNVALVAAAAFTAALGLRVSRRAAAGGAIAVILGFAAIVGSEPSVLRAAIMGTLVLAAMLLDREASVVNSLALAAIAILVARPGDLQDPGFQLSFAATLGIVLAPIPRGWLAGAIGVGVAAQLAVLPITLVHFNQVSTIGVVANLAVVPLAGAATILGLVGVAAGAASDVAARAFLDATWPILVALRMIVRGAAAAPGALVHLPAPPAAAVLAYALALGAGLLAWRRREGRPAATRTAAVTAVVLLGTAVAAAAWPVIRPGDGRLHVSILDAGRAHAVVVVTPDRRGLVILGGARGDVAGRVVAPYLWNQGVRRLAGIVAPDEARAAAAGLRALFPTAAPGPGDRLGAVTVHADPSGEAARLEYGLASIAIVLGPAATRPPTATVLVVPAGSAAPEPTAVAIVSGAARDRDAAPTGERATPVRDPAPYRTDRDGAVLVETDGRTLDVTRWVGGTRDRYCLDPESPCPPAARF